MQLNISCSKTQFAPFFISFFFSQITFLPNSFLYSIIILKWGKLGLEATNVELHRQVLQFFLLNIFDIKLEAQVSLYRSPDIIKSS
jgi:hypothetical protein